MNDKKKTPADAGKLHLISRIGTLKAEIERLSIRCGELAVERNAAVVTCRGVSDQMLEFLWELMEVEGVPEKMGSLDMGIFRCVNFLRSLKQFKAMKADK